MLQPLCYLRALSQKCRQRLAYEAFEAESYICFPALSSHPSVCVILGNEPLMKGSIKALFAFKSQQKGNQLSAVCVSSLFFFSPRWIIFTSHTHTLEHTGCQTRLRREREREPHHNHPRQIGFSFHFRRQRSVLKVQEGERIKWS